jgi:hypothetical protein
MTIHTSAKATSLRFPSIGLEFWGPAFGLGLLLWAVEFSYAEFSFIREVLGQNTPEGVAAGWWWSISVIWLISALRRSGDARRDPMYRGFRFYLFSAFSLLGGVEIVQQGLHAALGFLVGAGAFAAVFSLADLSAASLKSFRSATHNRRAEVKQLSLPFN